MEYLNKAIFLADSLRLMKDQLFGKRLRFIAFYKIEKNSDKALAYLEQNEDLKQYFINQGIINYNIGTVYQYSGRYDSAVTSYLKDESIISAKFSPTHQIAFYKEVAESYKGLNKTDLAIAYFEKAYEMGKNSGDLFTNDTLTRSLAQLYVNQKHKTDQDEKIKEDLRRRNLQYTGISMVTAFLFIILLVFGMFPISKVTIRMLNFFSFICLFEFIILLIDNWLHDLTHGAPLQIWLAKIFIIALLLPLHHTLEHVAVKFLSSHKLMRFRQKLSIKKLLRPSKRTVKRVEENLEESTLV
jgi:tetratricopeptide (TPR) repeat protein